MRKEKEAKFLLSAEPVDGFHMSDYDFEIELYISPNRTFTLKKGDARVIKNNDDNYTVCITSDVSVKLGRGLVMFDYYAAIPDSDFPDGYRTEAVRGVCTGVTL